jgi:hypothetical protein
MAYTDIQADDYGWIARLTLQQDGVAVDISSYTTLQLIFRDPSGTQSAKTATFNTDGTDGVLKYTVADGDIDVAGSWRVRARVAKTGVELHSEWHLFTVGN